MPFTSYGTSIPDLPKFEMFREKCNCPPNDSYAPVRNKPGISASNEKVVNSPRPLPIPVGASAANRTLFIRPSPNLRLAQPGYGFAGGTPICLKAALRRRSYLKQAKSAVAPVSSITTPSAPTTGRPPRGSRLAEKDFPHSASASNFGDGNPSCAITEDSKETGEYGGQGSVLEEGKDEAAPAP